MARTVVVMGEQTAADDGTVTVIFLLLLTNTVTKSTV